MTIRDRYNKDFDEICNYAAHIYFSAQVWKCLVKTEFARKDDRTKLADPHNFWVIIRDSLTTSVIVDLYNLFGEHGEKYHCIPDLIRQLESIEPGQARNAKQTLEALSEIIKNVKQLRHSTIAHHSKKAVRGRVLSIEIIDRLSTQISKLLTQLSLRNTEYILDILDGDAKYGFDTIRKRLLYVQNARLKALDNEDWELLHKGLGSL